MRGIFLGICQMIAVSIIQYIQRQDQFPLIRAPSFIIRIQEPAIPDAKTQCQLVPPFCIKINFDTGGTILGLNAWSIGGVERNSGIIKKCIRANPQKINQLSETPVRICQRKIIINSKSIHLIKIFTGISPGKREAIGKSDLVQRIALLHCAFEHQAMRGSESREI